MDPRRRRCGSSPLTPSGASTMTTGGRVVARCGLIERAARRREPLDAGAGLLRLMDVLVTWRLYLE